MDDRKSLRKGLDESGEQIGREAAEEMFDIPVVGTVLETADRVFSDD